MLESRRSCIFVLLLLFILKFGSVACLLQILVAEKKVDLTSHIVRTLSSFKVENAGGPPTSDFLLAFPPHQADHLALVRAQIVYNQQKGTSVPCDVSPRALPEGLNGTAYFVVRLPDPLPDGETMTIETLHTLTHASEPFPAEISQSEPQLVYYHDSATILSPYPVKRQTTYIKLPSKRVESFTQVNATVHTGTTLKYGPYKDSPPNSFSPILVHLESNFPFLTIEELVREVEISHWGSILIKEHYKLVHSGARLKGVFSRLEYQYRRYPNGAPALNHLLAILPPKVHSMFYRDEIGNISSSNLRTYLRKSELELEPRYPLFGGWEATFVIGYSLPLQHFLFEAPGGKRYLNLSFGCPIAETVTDKLIIKVVLPEGSKDPSVVVPFPLKQHIEKKYSYLDVIGRPVLVFEKTNVVPEHNVPFQVYYKFNPIFMLAEPLMIASAVFLLFLACTAYLHVDLSIRKW